MSKKEKKSQFKLLFLCAEVLLAVVALVLLMATPGVKYTLSTIIGNGEKTVAGIACIFGNADPKVNLTWCGLLAFILVAVAVALLVVLIVLSLGKKKLAFVGLLKLIVAGLLIAAGVFVFFVVPAFTAANGDGSFAAGNIANATYSIGAGWIIAAIVSIVAGALVGVEIALDK